jgi:hypothetical protein
MQIPRLTNSDLDTASPRNRKARIVANMGDVLPRKASFDKETSLTARLNTKKVIVPRMALTRINFQASGGTFSRSTLSDTAIK